MAPSGYCEPADLNTLGVQEAALASIPDPVKVAAISTSAAMMDSYFRAQFSELDGAEPGYKTFTSWGDDVRRCNAILAVWDLMVIRGFSPSAGSDEVLRMRYEDLVGRPGQSGWLDKVAKQQVVPNLKPRATDSAAYLQPRVTSRDPRGWT